MQSHRSSLRVSLVAIVVLAAACGGEPATDAESVTASPVAPAATGPTSSEPVSPPATPTSPRSSAEPTTPPEPSPPAASTQVPSASASDAHDSSTTSGDDAALPGESVDFGPRAGTVLAVIGVDHDDHLNLRAGPGTDQAVLTGLAPTERDVIAQGETRRLTGFWYRVEVDGTVGWVSARYVAQLGRVDDVTADVVAALGGPPTAATMAALGRLVAESQLPESEPGSWIATVVAPTEMADPGEVTMDVVGLADDSVRGLRLHVFGTPTDGGYSLRSVEQTLLCDRGVSDDGRCV